MYFKQGGDIIGQVTARNASGSYFSWQPTVTVGFESGNKSSLSSVAANQGNTISNEEQIYAVSVVGQGVANVSFSNSTPGTISGIIKADSSTNGSGSARPYTNIVFEGKGTIQSNKVAKSNVSFGSINNNLKGRENLAVFAIGASGSWTAKNTITFNGANSSIQGDLLAQRGGNNEITFKDTGSITGKIESHRQSSILSSNYVTFEKQGSITGDIEEIGGYNKIEFNKPTQASEAIQGETSSSITGKVIAYGSTNDVFFYNGGKIDGSVLALSTAHWGSTVTPVWAGTNNIAFYADANSTRAATEVAITGQIKADAHNTSGSVAGTNNIFFKNQVQAATSSSEPQKITITEKDTGAITAKLGDININRQPKIRDGESGWNLGATNITSSVKTINLTTGAITAYGNLTIKLGESINQTQDAPSDNTANTTGVNTLVIGKGSFRSYDSNAEEMDSGYDGGKGANKYAFSGLLNSGGTTEISFKGQTNTFTIDESNGSNAEDDRTYTSGGKQKTRATGLYTVAGTTNITFHSNQSSQNNTLNTISITSSNGKLNIGFGAAAQPQPVVPGGFIKVTDSAPLAMRGAESGEDKLIIENNFVSTANQTDAANNILFNRDVNSEMTLTNGALRSSGGATNITFKGNQTNTLNANGEQGEIRLEGGGATKITFDTTSGTNTINAKTLRISNNAANIAFKGATNTFAIQGDFTEVSHKGAIKASKIAFDGTTSNTFTIGGEMSGATAIAFKLLLEAVPRQEKSVMQLILLHIVEKISSLSLVLLQHQVIVQVLPQKHLSHLIVTLQVHLLPKASLLAMQEQPMKFASKVQELIA